MPSWLPGDDYMTNFKVGDPYVRVDDGYARLPGAGYEALHPELKGLNAEDYPDIHKLRILSDVAPYSKEYYTRSLRPAPHKKPRARAPGRSSIHDRAPHSDSAPGFNPDLAFYATRASSILLDETSVFIRARDFSSGRSRSYVR
jgi:hypothetical protein